MFVQVTAKNVGGVFFFETQCRCIDTVIHVHVLASTWWKMMNSLVVWCVGRWLQQTLYSHLMKLDWTMLIKSQLLANGKSKTLLTENCAFPFMVCYWNWFFLNFCFFRHECSWDDSALSMFCGFLCLFLCIIIIIIIVIILTSDLTRFNFD